MSKENNSKAIKLKYGSIYQKEEGGNYFFRYRLPGDQRKAVSLKTKNLREAKKLAETYIPIIEAPSPEVIAAHVNHAKFGVRKRSLPLSGAWMLYSQHPERAMPATVSEEDAYRFTWREFCEFIKKDIQVSEVTPQHAQEYANHMRTVAQSVETHNRKLRRLKRIFKTLHEYTKEDNPFNSAVLRRREREEQNTDVRRLAFSKEQESKLIEVLSNSKHKVKNKEEIRVLYFLGMFTGQRLKDCALLKWSRVDLRKKRIWVKQFKTGCTIDHWSVPKVA
jgi:hypothetical protein